MVRIAISQAAFEAIAKTLPFGSVGYENKTNEKGEWLIWVKLAGVLTAGCAATQWKARFPRHYPPPLEPPLANRAFSSFCEGLNPGRLTHPAKRKQLRHQNLAQPTMCGVVASRLMPDHINRQRR
jgi:hypothetical protein